MFAVLSFVVLKKKFSTPDSIQMGHFSGTMLGDLANTKCLLAYPHV